jgi:hypothetical protein
MTMTLLRITTVLVLLLAGVTFSFCPSVAASLSDPQTADRCCGHAPAESAPATEGGDCGGAECGCVTCLVVILPASAIEFSSSICCAPLHHHNERQAPTGYQVRIDYPPENC